MNRARSFIRLLLTVLALALISVPSIARADNTAPVIAAPPADAPHIAENVHVPPVPKGFVERDLGWMQVYYPSSAEERIAPAIVDAEALRTKLAADLGVPVLDHVEVRITHSPEEMAELAPEEAPPPKYASGVAYGPLRLALISLRAPMTYEAVDVQETLRHELTHLALEDATRGLHVPRWFNEGLAVQESGESALARWKTLSSASLSGTLIPLSELDRFPNDTQEVSIAYAESADFVRYLMHEQDMPRFRDMLGRVRNGVPFDRALSDAYGTDLRKLEYEWREDVANRHSLWPELASASIVWTLLIVVLVAGYVKRRQRTKATLARWAIEEAREDELRERIARAAAEEDFAQVNVVELPHVEHDGRFHTLH